MQENTYANIYFVMINKLDSIALKKTNVFSQGGSMPILLITKEPSDPVVSLRKEVLV